MQPAIHDSALVASFEGRAHRIVNEALESSSSSSNKSSAPKIITEKFAMATESMPSEADMGFETETLNNEIPTETTALDYSKSTGRDQEQLIVMSTTTSEV